MNIDLIGGFCPVFSVLHLEVVGADSNNNISEMLLNPHIALRTVAIVAVLATMTLVALACAAFKIISTRVVELGVTREGEVQRVIELGIGDFSLSVVLEDYDATDHSNQHRTQVSRSV